MWAKKIETKGRETGGYLMDEKIYQIVAQIVQIYQSAHIFNFPYQTKKFNQDVKRNINCFLD